MAAREPQPGVVFDERGKRSAERFAKKVAGCAICGGVALYRCGARGYCKAHIDDAKRHTLKNSQSSSYHANRNGTDVGAEIDDQQEA